MSDIGERLAQLTFELCAIPSVTGDERAICDHVEAWGRRLFPAQHVRRFGNSLVFGAWEDSRPTVLLAGHLDTVPPDPMDGPARLESDRIVGRGASDMKAGDAVMMALAETCDLARLPYNLVFVFYEAEEGPYDRNGLEPILQAMPELQRSALAFCLESSDLEVQVGCLGSMHGRATFTGKGAHSARPWQGENAIYKAIPVLEELSRFERRRVVVEGYEFFEVLSATLAQGGRATNMVPDRFVLNLNYRFAPGKSLAQAELELRAFIGDRAELEIWDKSPAGPVCARNPLLRRFLQSSGARSTSKQAWTDVGRLGAYGIDAVNYGPGHTSQAHQRGEHVRREALEPAYRALKTFFETAG